MKNLILSTGLLSISILAIFGACSDMKEQQKTGMSEQPQIQKAVAMIYPTEGNDVQGMVTFTKVNSGILVMADISGLTPGKHGFHIHEYGDCSLADGTSAGGHFNPLNMPHGAPTDVKRHLGDLGNLTADDTGKAHYEWTDPLIKLNGPNSIVGRALIIHQGEDDLKTQPTGNAGARVACGVIGQAK